MHARLGLRESSFLIRIAQKRGFFKNAFKSVSEAANGLTNSQKPTEKHHPVEDRILDEVLDKMVGKNKSIGSTILRWGLKSGMKIMGAKLQKIIAESGQEIEHVFNIANTLIRNNLSLFGNSDVHLGVITSFNTSTVNGKMVTTLEANVSSIDNPAINNGVATIRATKQGSAGLQVQSLVVQTYAGDIIDVPVGNSEKIAAQAKPIIIDVESR